MSDQKNDMRVLARTSARIVTQEEIARVIGGQGRPTGTLSRDPKGNPVDITQD
ncbi:MAG TPA: hypothetical protein VFB76_06945 [Candidatus Angelobacter sp.]|nr:hypothetical protein [Candidatus Angelobacter sp.]